MTQSQNYSAADQQDKMTSQGQAPEEKKRGRAGKSASAFRTISEVAGELDVQQHVLRFWETKFSQVRPLKRGGGRRYYRPEDVALLKKIHTLLYTEGYTIKGVQKLLREHGKNFVLQEEVSEISPVASNNDQPDLAQAYASQSVDPQDQPLSSKQRSILNAMLGDLKELRGMIKDEK